MTDIAALTKDMRGFDKEQAEVKFNIIKDCIKQRHDFLFNDANKKIEQWYECYKADYIQFAGMYMDLQGQDKGWDCSFWVPEVEESQDPREVIRYHKE